MVKYIDIHSHDPVHDPNVIEIIVANIQTLTVAPPITDISVCVGLHPWFIEDIDFNKFQTILKHYMASTKFYALGEIGLDKKCIVDYEKQKEIFKAQLELVNRFRIPRVIIHSVKAHSDIIHFLKEMHISQKVLIHDFYASLETAEQYLKFDCYFSFGKKIFTNSNAQNALRSLPKDRIFLETDDQLDYNIFEIYSEAARLLQTSESELKELLFSNYKAFSLQVSDDPSQLKKTAT